jgi:hypothetical protein
VPVEKTKSVKSEQKPSAPIRRGKDMDGIFEAWKSATYSKQAKLQTRKRKRDDAKAAESLEKMRRDAVRADKMQAAEIETRKQANALAWLEKHMEIALITDDTEKLAGLRQEYEHLFEQYSK